MADGLNRKQRHSYFVSNRPHERDNSSWETVAEEARRVVVAEPRPIRPRSVTKALTNAQSEKIV